MKKQVHFRVNSQLSELFSGDFYSSAEDAILELINNAWDADATEVAISIPDILDNSPIRVSDNGSGMTATEVEINYLNIAHSRTVREGDTTAKFARKIMGKRGVGKFSGLAISNEMRVSTVKLGKKTSFSIRREDFGNRVEDIEEVALSIETSDAPENITKTSVDLIGLSGMLPIPSIEKLKRKIVLQYGATESFVVVINGSPVSVLDYPGSLFKESVQLPDESSATLAFVVAEKPLPVKRAGIAVVSAGKVVFSPSFWGIEKDASISAKLRNRLIGVLSISSPSIPASFLGMSPPEEHPILQTVVPAVKEIVRKALKATHKTEFNAARARWQKSINAGLAKIPECRREFARKKIESYLAEHYADEPNATEERISQMVELLLDGIEKDEYWLVCQEIENARHSEVVLFSEALEEFGLTDMSYTSLQIRHRLNILNDLDELWMEKETKEISLHTVLARNLWVFGFEYGLLSSNKTMSNLIHSALGKHYLGYDSKDRPDLFLASSKGNNHLIVEFKRPSVTVGRHAGLQVQQYADTIHKQTGWNIDCLVVGGKVDPVVENNPQGIKYIAFSALISMARESLEWLLSGLSRSLSTDYG